MGRTRIFAALAALAMLTACGDTFAEQSLYGAAGGAVVSGALGGDVATGALVGAAANVLACDSGEVNCS